MEDTERTWEFPTGGEFRGKTVHGRMDGPGEYLFPSGTKYVGEFKDGMFHGSGTLFFPNGGCLEATWNRGQATGPGVGGKYIFKDQLEYGEDMWEYCTLKDRRFYSEICNGIKPAGRTQLTDASEPPEIPLGWYDCGEGLYNPSNRVVYKYNKDFLRNADTDEHDWIVRTCRKGVTQEEQFPIGKD